MDALAPLKEAYDRDGKVPDKTEFENIALSVQQKQSAEPEPKTETDYKSMDTEALRKRRKSLTNQITRKENQLLYQSDSKQPAENPMPDSPKRVKLTNQVESLKAERSKVEYELASRS